jgi:hypothetical protein
MPCTLCGNDGHNRRTCQRWDILIATRIEEENNVNISSINSTLHSIEPVTTEHMTDRNTPNDNDNSDTTLSLSLLNLDNSFSDNDTNIITPIISRHRPNTPPPHNISRRALFTHTPYIPTSPPADTTDWWQDSDDEPLPDIQLYTPNTHSISKKTKTLVDIVTLPCHTNDCPICMEDLLQTDLFVTRCGHQFHGTCMIKHIKFHDNCPMCRGLLFATNHSSKSIL